MVTFIGRVSPGSTPARNTSVFVVMVLSAIDGAALLPSLFLLPVLADELGSLASWKLWLLLLGRLEELTLLGDGLSGGRSADASVKLFGVCIDKFSGAVVVSEDADLDFVLGLVRFDTGSSVTMRALGAGNGAISMFSRRLTRFRQETVGFIVTGRVKVDVSEYEIAPRSNCSRFVSTDRCKNNVAGSHIDATGK